MVQRIILTTRELDQLKTKKQKHLKKLTH